MPDPQPIIARRRKWTESLGSYAFAESPLAIAAELESEIDSDGLGALKDHLILAGVIPESFGHDSTAEKVFAKYTDSVIAVAFNHLGTDSLVLDARADSADVEGRFPTKEDFVADAKAFRLSRSAKNQKDFKVGALASWQKGAKFAALVGPLYQYPSSSSQIYEQASSHGVCLMSYAHLSAMLDLPEHAQLDALLRVFAAPAQRRVEKSAATYWAAIRSAFTENGKYQDVWVDALADEQEKLSLLVAEEKSYLDSEVERIAALSHDELVAELAIKMKLPGRLKVLRGATSSSVLKY